MAVFHDDEERRSYLRLMAEEAERFGVEIFSWCLMTEVVRKNRTTQGLLKRIGLPRTGHWEV
jgi:hypothetical protein